MPLELEQFIKDSQGIGANELYLEKPTGSPDLARLQARGKAGTYTVNEAVLKEDRKAVAQALREAIQNKIQSQSFLPSNASTPRSPNQVRLQKISVQIDKELEAQLQGEVGLTGDDVLKITAKLEKQLKEAARTTVGENIVKGVRAKHARIASDRVAAGTAWSADVRAKQAKIEADRAAVAAGINWPADVRISAITERAQENFSALQKRTVKQGILHAFKPMNSQEIELYESMLDANYYLTHFTQQDLTKNPDASGKVVKGNTMVLRSRESLLSKNMLPAVATGNTSAWDIKRYKTDDFAFFALEVGDRPQKTTSIFGDRIYRIPIDEISKHGGLMLVNDLIHSSNLAQSKRELFELPGILDLTKTKAKTYNPDGSEDRTSTSSVYPGDATRASLACLTIERIRLLRPDQQQEVFKLAKSQDGINSIVNGFFRPQVLVPQSFFTSKFQEINLTTLHTPIELVSALQSLDPKTAGYKDMLDHLYVVAKSRIPAYTEASFTLPLDDQENNLLAALEKHADAIGERNIAKLYINRISRLLCKKTNIEAKNEMEEILKNSTLNTDIKKQIKDVFK